MGSSVWIRVAAALAVVAVGGVIAILASPSADMSPAPFAAFCDRARRDAAVLSGSQGDDLLVEALAALERMAPASLSSEVRVVVEGRRALAGVGASPSVDEAMAVADQVMNAEGAPLERLNRALGSECEIEERVPAIGH